MFNKLKNKGSKILGSTFGFLLLMPCNFYPFAYIKTDGDMNNLPLAFWVIGKSQFLLWDLTSKLFT